MCDAENFVFKSSGVRRHLKAFLLVSRYPARINNLQCALVRRHFLTTILPLLIFISCSDCVIRVSTYNKISWYTMKNINSVRIPTLTNRINMKGLKDFTRNCLKIEADSMHLDIMITCELLCEIAPDGSMLRCRRFDIFYTW